MNEDSGKKFENNFVLVCRTTIINRTIKQYGDVNRKIVLEGLFHVYGQLKTGFKAANNAEYCQMKKYKKF